MSDRGPYPEADDGAVLRAALESLPVPEMSNGFEERVLAGLRSSLPWWRRLCPPGLWSSVRPVLAGGACALVLTLALYSWAAHLPLEAPPHPVQGGDHSVALERMLQGLDTNAIGLSPFTAATVSPRPPRHESTRQPQRRSPDDRSSVPTSPSCSTAS